MIDDVNRASGGWICVSVFWILFFIHTLLMHCVDDRFCLCVACMCMCYAPSKLSIHLPHRVDETRVSAKWDKAHESLAVTMPIIREED